MLESYLISVIIKSTVLLAAGLICLRLLRGQDAAVRHLVCLVALASAAAMPLLAFWQPQWSLLISVSPSPVIAPAGEIGAAGGWSWPTAIVAIWVIGIFVMTLRAAGGWVVLLRARWRSEPFQDRDGAEVRIGNIGTPLTCGMLHPLILLPEAARDWNEPRLRAVLLHESAHVRRRDCMAKYVAQVSRALLWWNPLVWVLAARMNHEQELACDDAVLAAGVPADAYATVLLDVVRECSSSLVLGCAMGDNSAAALRARFEHLFEWRREASASTRRTAIAIPLLLLLLTTVSFAEKIYKIGPGIVAPKVLEKHDPVYPEKERDAKTEGTVALSLVVGIDQRAHDIKVAKSATPGLDASAVTAVRSWLFQPGTKNGRPVPVRAKIEMNFRLQ